MKSYNQKFKIFGRKKGRKPIRNFNTELLQKYLLNLSSDFVKKNIILDIGSGNGENTLFLSQKYNRHIRVMTPQKGERKLIIEHALDNSKQALKRHMKEIISNFDNIKGLKEVFNLEKIPRRIEVYDNSHIQGSHSTGAMIVAIQEI